MHTSIHFDAAEVKTVAATIELILVTCYSCFCCCWQMCSIKIIEPITQATSKCCIHTLIHPYIQIFIMRSIKFLTALLRFYFPGCCPVVIVSVVVINRIFILRIWALASSSSWYQVFVCCL